MLLMTNNDFYTIRTLGLFGINCRSGSKSLLSGNNISGRNLITGLFDPRSQKTSMFFKNILVAFNLGEVFHFARVIFHVSKLLAMAARVVNTVLESFCPKQSNVNSTPECGKTTPTSEVR